MFLPTLYYSFCLSFSPVTSSSNKINSINLRFAFRLTSVFTFVTWWSYWGLQEDKLSGANSTYDHGKERTTTTGGESTPGSPGV